MTGLKRAGKVALAVLAGVATGVVTLADGPAQAPGFA